MRARYSEAEIQLLIAALELEAPVETPNNVSYRFYPRTLEDAASYFRGLREDWSSASASLREKGLLRRGASGPALTGEGAAEAARLREARPPIYYWYEEFYAEASRSPAFAEFCERLYGRALCQDGFSDMAQVEAMLDEARIGEGCRVADLGCGPGMISEYVADTRAALVTGMDYSPRAIALASERTAAKRDRLTFLTGNLDSLPFAPASFDALVSIDTLYMPKDLAATLAQMRGILAPGGRMAVFYTSMIRAGESRDLLAAGRNPMGAALGAVGLPYRSLDFSRENHLFLQRKRRTIESLREAFAGEGRSFLYDYLFAQSEGSRDPYDPAASSASRYLYLIEP